MWQTVTESKEGLKILARIIARAYLADNQSNNSIGKTRKKGRKDESLRRAIGNKSHGKGSQQSQG
jgi:hypothetical protein